MGRALSDAAEHAAEHLGPTNGPASNDATRLELQRVCDAVCGTVDRPEKTAASGGAPAAFARPHVDAFRRVFLSRLAEGHPKRANGQSVVAVLRAIDSLPVRDESVAASPESVEQQIRADALNGMLEIAHDMRSPLAAILLLVDPIRRGQYGAVTETQERQLGLVYGAALSLSTLANDIIDAARGERAIEAARSSNKPLPMWRKVPIISFEKLPTKSVGCPLSSTTPTSIPIPARALPFSS
jgi:signal transduction histidine kinase